MSGLEVMPSESKNCGADRRQFTQSGNPWMTLCMMIFETSVESLVDELGEGGCPGTFQYGHRLFALQCTNDIPFREGMK